MNVFKATFLPRFSRSETLHQWGHSGEKVAQSPTLDMGTIVPICESAGGSYQPVGGNRGLWQRRRDCGLNFRFAGQY
jgi:hypothetical protein